MGERGEGGNIKSRGRDPRHAMNETRHVCGGVGYCTCSLATIAIISFFSWAWVFSASDRAI